LPCWSLASPFNPTPFVGGLLVDPSPLFVEVIFMDGGGNFLLPGLPGSLISPATIYAQVIYELPSAPQGFGFTNALRVVFKP
jgi:hypothetical protein